MSSGWPECRWAWGASRPGISESTHTSAFTTWRQQVEKTVAQRHLLVIFRKKENKNALGGIKLIHDHVSERGEGRQGRRMQSRWRLLGQDREQKQSWYHWLSSLQDY